jgi:aminopeptidase N
MTLLAAVFSAAADQPFSFAATPGQLPKTVVPHHYALRIEPNLEKFTTRGSMTVDMEVLKPVKEILLNAVDLKVTRATLQGNDIRKTNLKIKLLPEKQSLSLKLPRELPPGNYRLAMEFTGKLSQQAEGFFYAKYSTTHGNKLMLATQMEPSDARRMFPCWDEPVFRATFDLTAVVPEKFKAFSNMPVERETQLKNGRKEVAFATTPPMSSYLVALVAGELETLESEADGVKIRLVTTEGKSDQGRYALDAAKKLLAYYDDYFGIKFSLPKLDLVAIPGGFDGAMENWGCITYNESTLLYDPASSSPQTQREIFVTVAHEMSHQWFGDLVTTAWWDNLWLNEGFATWMETKATDHFNPEWQMWLSADSDKSAVMSGDAQRPTHAIQQTVANESEANDAFDSITYQKGGAFLRMLENYLGEEPFRKGIQHYLAAHKNSNATTGDLWNALEEISGKPIHSLASGWTEQPGVPLVKVDADCVNGQRVVSLQQERLLDQRPRAKDELWDIPVSFISGSNAVSQTMLSARSNTLTLADCDALLKLNAGDAGYYRVWYAPALFEKLQQSIRQLSVADRFNVLDDCWAMVEADRGGIDSYFALAGSLKEEKSLAIWDEMLTTLNLLDEFEWNRPEHDAFQTYGRQFLQPQFQRLGWEQKPGKSSNDTLLRGKIISALGHYGDAAIIAEAKARFEKFLSVPESLPPDLRPAVLKIAGRYGDQRIYGQIRELARRASSTEDRQLYYGALTAALDPALARETLELSLKDELSPEEATGLVLAVAGNVQHSELAWEFTRRHLRELLAKVDPFSRDDFLPSVFSKFSDNARADELETFSEKNLPEDALAKARETATEIRFKARLKQRVLKTTDQWISKQNLTTN